MPAPVTSQDFQQLVRTVLEDSRELGRLSAFSKEIYENTLNNSLRITGSLEGELRHLRLSDRDLWVSYQPSFLTLSSQDGGEPQVSSHGDVYVHVCTDHGQLWHHHIGEGKPSSIMDFDDDELLLQVRFGMRREEFDAITQGEIANTIAPHRAYKVTAGEPNWQKLGNTTPILQAPGGDSFSMASFNINDSVRSSSGYIGALGNSLGNVSHINVHVSRFQGREFFNDVSGRANTERAEREFEAMAGALVVQSVSAAHHAAVDKQSKILEAAGVQIDWTSLRNQLVYAVPVMNFIAEGATAKSKLYRAQFVEQSLTLMFGDANAPLLAEMELGTAWQRVRQLVADARTSSWVADPQIVGAIDQGEYPSAQLSKKWGLPHLSKSQFQRAMHLFGGYRQLNGNGNGTSFRHPLQAVMSALSHKDRPFEALALAKLPAEWFRWEPNGPDLLTAQGVSELYQRYANTGGKDSRDGLLDAARMLMDNKALPYLISTGKELDRLRGVQNTQIQNGIDDVGTKQQIRELGLQWRWMTSGPGDLGQRLHEFNEKHKIHASFGDYAGILHQLWSAVYFRALLNHDHISPKESFGFSSNSSQIYWDDDAIHREMMQYLDDHHEPSPSEDEFEDADMLPSDFHEPSSAPDMHFIDNLIRQARTDFRAPVRMNDDLHKIYSTFLREANTGSELNVNWLPLLDAPVKFPEFELHSISNRLDLLTEGSEMKHCVFSYLNRCMSGESIVLSAREPGTGNRLATIELTPERVRPYDPDSPIKLELQQCYGYRNSSTQSVKAVQSVIETWLQSVNRGDIPTNAFRIAHDKSHMEDLMELVESDPANNGAMLQSIPYNEDGVFLAYYLFNKYTPEGMSIQNLADQNTVIGMVYHHSQFKRDIETIESIAQTYQQEPEFVVRVKMQTKLSTWSQVSDLLGARRHCLSPVNAMISEYDGQMTAEQIYQRSGALIAQHGLQFSPGYTAVQFERDRAAGSDWQLSTVPLPKMQPVLRGDTSPAPESLSVRRRA